MAIRHKQVILGRLAHSKGQSEVEISPRAALGVSERGVIILLDIGVTSAEEAYRKHADFTDAFCPNLKPLQFLFPGLIDTHLHAPKSVVIHWQYLQEASYKDIEKAKRVYSEIVETELTLDTTTCGHNSSPHVEATNVLADMWKKYGQHAVIGELCITLNSTHGNWEVLTEQSIKDANQSIEYIQKIDSDGELILSCVQPRGGPYMTLEGMASLGKLCQDEKGEFIRVQAYMCETPGEFSWTREVHPGFKHYSEMNKAGVCHNPNRNTCLLDGECRVRQLLKAGVKVGLGTDCSAGYLTSILDAMRQASNVSRHLAIPTGSGDSKLGFEEIVNLGTLGSEQVFALDDKIGNLEAGKAFDAPLVDIRLPDQIPNIRGWENDDLASPKKWVLWGDDRLIREVFAMASSWLEKNTVWKVDEVAGRRWYTVAFRLLWRLLEERLQIRLRHYTINSGVGQDQLRDWTKRHGS